MCSGCAGVLPACIKSRIWRELWNLQLYKWVFVFLPAQGLLRCLWWHCHRQPPERGVVKYKLHPRSKSVARNFPNSAFPVFGFLYNLGCGDSQESLFLALARICSGMYKLS